MDRAKRAAVRAKTGEDASTSSGEGFEGESCLLGDGIWERLREEAKTDLEGEPALASYLYSTVLAHKSIEDVLAFVLANKLRNNVLLDSQLLELFSSQYKKYPELGKKCLADMQAVYERDPACDRYLAIVLFFKGFQAIQAQRVAHSLWLEDRKALSLLLQNRISEVFHVDIHPGAVLGQGMMMDHATGVVIGETAVVGENVSILHGVTLGGTGTSQGDRHPKVGDGVVIGANVTILGNINIGADTKIGAGSVVLDDIPEGSTAVGIPAKVINRGAPQQPSLSMDQTSYITDYFHLSRSKPAPCKFSQQKTTKNNASRIFRHVAFRTPRLSSSRAQDRARRARRTADRARDARRVTSAAPPSRAPRAFSRARG